MTQAPLSNKHCLICKDGRKNECLYWHKDPDTGDIWVWCQGKCKRGYSIYEYCAQAGISLREFLKLSFDFNEAKALEVNASEWPRTFLSLADPASQKGVDYLASRGLVPSADIAYDSGREGIVLSYYYQNTFVGAQIRFITPRKTADGDDWKITTLPGTRLGYLFWGWSQNTLPPTVKYIVLTEGAFNAMSIQQSLNTRYGNLLKNPYRCIAASGSSVSDHQQDQLKVLISQGIKVIAAPDSDEAGLKMLDKLRSDRACTHYSLVLEDGLDWNDVLIRDGESGLAKMFAANIKQA
jgi:hypothetical protein